MDERGTCMGKTKVTSNTVYDKKPLEKVKRVPAVYRYIRIRKGGDK